MFQREQITDAYTCPTCHTALTSLEGALRCTQPNCAEEGGFFAYGPLLVRIPDSDTKSREAAMPWEGNLKQF
ncbi:MAG TPA: hypothetical protein PKA05_02515 [Roseiflexaceae bacterium]|nr:hypothetical protein [Roseiflexaceae bacterium]